MSPPDGSAQFEAVDWTEIDRSRRLITAERTVFTVGCVLLLSLYQYDQSTGLYLVGSWQADRLDYVSMFGVTVLVSFTIGPLLRRTDRTRFVLRQFLAKPRNVLASLVLTAIAVGAFVFPILVGSPELRFQYSFHAPVGFSGRMGWTGECLGTVTQAEGVTRRCSGSWANPLGTNHRGIALGTLLVEGARVAAYVMIFTAAFVVPLAAIVGIVAGFRGGRIDDLLMSYVDVQLCIPAIVVYFIGYMYWNVSLLLLLATFGLLSWGGIARIVRSETLQRREDGYVLVARSLGASPAYIGRRHVLPNITNTLVPAVFHLLALLVIVEAGVAFLGFHHLETYSWGSTIQEGLDPPIFGLGFEMDAHEIWWISTVPTIALTVTVLSLKIVGDGLRDALDPQLYQ